MISTVVQFPPYPKSITFPLVEDRPWLLEDEDPPSRMPEVALPERTFALDLSQPERAEHLRRVVIVYDEMGKDTWPSGPVPKGSNATSGRLPECSRMISAILLTVPSKLRIAGIGDLRRWEFWTARAIWGDYSAPDVDPAIGSLRPHERKPRREPGGPRPRYADPADPEEDQ